jgi:transcriptional regulator with XRE-family HTH domain
MSDLTLTEQKHVRTAMRYLRRRAGTWAAVAQAIGLSPQGLEKTVSGRRAVTASVALRVARLANAPFDELLSGHFLPGACPRCGYVPDFAEDEHTVAEIIPSATECGGLKLVK